MSDLENAINANPGQPILIDFYADWCVACLEYEKYTFQDIEVNTLMRDFYRIQIDVTDNNEEHKNLLRKFNLFGPPGVLFFDKQGTQLQQYDIVGFKNANEFASILKKIKHYDQ